MGSINSKKNIILFGLHAFLAFISVYTKFIGLAWGAGIVMFGLYHIVKNRNANNEAAMYAAYFVGLEVVLRINKGFILYEQGKYAVMLFLIVGLLVQKHPHFIPRQFIVFILLLIPSVFLVDMGDIDAERKAILFNLSGPFSLAFSAIYFYKRQIDKETLYKIFLYLMLPVFAAGVILFFKTPDLSTLKFGTDSNAALSGGFGPNQVSTILGLGIFVGVLAYLSGYTLTGFKILDIAIILFLALRGLLTFSRGGVVGAVLGIAAALFFILKHRNDSKLIMKVIVGSILIGIGGLGIWSYTNTLTGGTLALRYQGRSINDPNKVNFTTGRMDIIEEELGAFAEYPILGTGVGMGKLYRGSHGGRELAAHTEYSRLVAEHGIYGVFALLLLIFSPVTHLFKINQESKYLFAGFLIISLFTMFHGAMRLAMPGFMYGISYIWFLNQNAPVTKKPKFPVYNPPHLAEEHA